MNNPDLLDRINSIKTKIEKFIEEGYIAEADTLLDQLYKEMPGDPDVCSMRAVIRIIEGRLDEAESTVKEGLVRDSVHFDLLFNLGYIREQQGLYQEAADLYCKSNTAASTSEQKQNVVIALERLKSVNSEISYSSKPKIVFFVKKGMDSFLGDIIDNLEKSYWTRKIIVNDLKQIDKGMEWADICWFEWCDELVIYGSGLYLASSRKIICRLHSYEAFTDNINKVNWRTIDRLILVAKHIKDLVLEKQPTLREDQVIIIPNGIDMDKFTYTDKKPGYNIAYVGYINYKKGPMLLLQTFKALYDADHCYKLYIAGVFQDHRDQLYFNQMIQELGIGDNVFFNGWQNDVNHWLDDKDYILCTSLLESQNISVMQAMCKGIKPVIHNFVGAKQIYPANYVWNTIGEAVDMIRSKKYMPTEYRKYISDFYSFDMQIDKIKDILKKLLLYQAVTNRSYDIFSGKEKPEDLSIHDLTILVPCYNRAAMLKGDFDNGFNFPLQPKLLIDDFSDEENKKILKSILDDREHYGKTEIVFHNKNLGVAAAFKTGVNAATTGYLLCRGDDDILFGSESYEEIKEAIPRIGIDVALITPRYLINYSGNSEFSIGYDKIDFNNRSASTILKLLFLKGELYAINAGAIFSRDNLLKCLPDEIFKVSEDYITTVRMLNMHKNLKVKVTEEFSYIRRISHQSLTRDINDNKLALNLLSMMVSGFYCLKNGLVKSEEFNDTLMIREDLLRKLFNFKKGLANMAIDYSFGKMKLEDFVLGLRTWGISVHNINELPREILELPKLLTI